MGFLGPGDVEPHLRHGVDFAEVARRAAGKVGVPADSVVDLGSGAGLPGLVMAVSWIHSRFLLVEASKRRASFLVDGADSLGVGDRVTVAATRAEDLGRTAAHRGAYPLVVARGFGRPAVTAECAAPLLRRGGILVVSAPPATTPPRWPADGLASLGMASLGEERGAFGFDVVRQEMPCPDRFPRRVGVPRKRPLF